MISVLSIPRSYRDVPLVKAPNVDGLVSWPSLNGRDWSPRRDRDG